MKVAIVKMVLRVALYFLLQNNRVKDVLSLVDEAEKELSNPFARRGHVYRKLKETEGEKTPTGDLNLALELGVSLYRLLDKK
jgi:hypothetical protein